MTTINGTLDSDFLLGTDTTDEIYGFDGDDTLDGGLGSDTLIGGAGDDSYIIDLTDTVDEKSSGGIDTINVSASYSIFTLAQVENLRLTGNSLSDATGNFLANLIEGNSANNRLTGGYGNDTLVGGLGVDTLVGGFDNDTYWLDNERDVVIEENSIVRLSLSSTQAQANGASQNATFSVDGTKVVFTSTANNLVAGDTNNVADIFIKDLVTGVVSCVSRDASGNQANGASQNATFSADGTKIIFTSTANNLVAGDTNNVADIFIKDLVTGVVSCVSRDASGNQANGASQNATFSVDGTKVIFTSTANNLVSGDTNSASDIFVKDLQTGIVTRLTTNSQGIQADGDTYEYNLSADGKKITFSSYASNLINGDTNFSFDIFVKDLQTGLVSRVSTSTNGTQANYESYRPIFAPDGQKVLFQSAASNLIVGDNNNALDYFVKDLNTGELICVTRNVTGQIANGESQYAIFSKDGKKIIFDSYASNLVSGDTNSTSDIFVKNLENGDVIRINLANNVQLNNQSIMPVLSNDGGKLLFTSSATNLVAGDSNNASDIFIIDLNDGHDIVYSSAGHFLEDNVENLTLIGDNPIYAIGNGLNNIITGNAGNNAIDGGVGIDTLIGGQGNDTYEIDNVNDIVIENENEGIDTINAAFSMSLVSFSNVENLFLSNRQTQTNGTGNHLNNVLSGATNSNNSHNVLDGGAGNDTLDGGSGIDTLIGGTGDDTYIVDSTTDTITELLAQGTDTIQSTVNFSLSSILHVENISLKGQASNAVGNSLDNVLIGNSLNNTLSGMDGNDTLIGGTGIDTLVGGVGNDTYFVDSTSDTINELSNQGIDTINASVNFSLENYTNIENITLSGMASEAIGNSLDNIIIANSASNILDGASGIDTVLYSLSWSNYFIESLAEGARIKINDDIDILKNIEYIGFNGHVLSILEAINDAPIAFNDNVSELLIEEGIGETGISIRTGNVLTNDTDADLLLSIGEILSVSGVYNSSVGFVTTGRYGDLVLNSDGSYSYILNNNDIDTQSLVAGQSVIDSFTYTITDIHGLSSSAILTFNIQGSDDVTYITGTANNDDLLGTDTNDNIDSLAGNDTLNGGGGADTLLGGMGNDVIMGNEGDDNIDGGADADLMSGGLGNDVYTVDNIADQVLEQISQGTDTIQASVNYTLMGYVENLTLIGANSINGTGNSLNNMLTGNSANNILNGAKGSDTLLGGLGNDTYVIDSLGDVVTELAEQGIDTVQATISYTLVGQVENLELLGVANLKGTGNDLNNQLLGNAGNNVLTAGLGADTLNGGMGADTLYGGLGDDSYIINSSDDVVTETVNQGLDTVHSSIDYTLIGHVENLLLTGTAAINGTGNSLNNMLTGNSANNILDGAKGNDTLLGGLGNDTYIIDNIGDVVTELSNEGIDTIRSIINQYGLAAHVENLELMGGSHLTGIGNGLDNSLTGNSGNNQLKGELGADTLNGGAGNDTLTGGLGNDVYQFGRDYQIDTLVEADGTVGNTDIVAFMGGIAVDQLWFKRVGNNLEVSIIGTSDKVVVKSWYLSTDNQVEVFKTTDGDMTLLSTDVQALVSAMASIAPPPLGQTELSSEQHSQLDAVIAASWSSLNL